MKKRYCLLLTLEAPEGQDLESLDEIRAKRDFQTLMVEGIKVVGAKFWQKHIPQLPDMPKEG